MIDNLDYKKSMISDVIKNQIDYEVKTSILSFINMFNFVQIRPLVKTNYILYAYILNF